MIVNKVDSVYGVVKQADPKYYYTGETTDTATVSIDNKDKIIKVDVSTQGILGNTSDKAYPGNEGYTNRQLIDDLKDKLNDLETDFKNIELELNNSSKNLSLRIDSNVSDINQINEDIKSISQRIGTLEENLQGTTAEIIQRMQLEIEEISNSVEDLKKSVYGAISNVSNRVTNLEYVIGDDTKGLIFDVDYIKSSIPEITDDINTLTKQVSGEDGLIESVQNNSQEIQNIKDYIDDVVLNPLKFTSVPSFPEPSIVEFGTIVDRNITWAVNKKPDKLTIGGKEVIFEGEDKDEDITYNSIDNSFTYKWKNISANSNTLKIRVDYKNQSIQQDFRITFTYYIYYGKGTLYSVFPDHLDNMNSKLSTTSAMSSATVKDIGSSEYFYYACPRSYNKPTFSVGGWVGGVEKVEEKSFTRKYGESSVSYDVYRSINDNLGTTTFTIT